MNELCGNSCCSKCELKDIICDGCAETNGHPCGGTCVAAECIQARGLGAMYVQEMTIAKEVNALQIEGLTVGDMNLLLGGYVNLEYLLPNGKRVKLLDDKRVYWTDQIERQDCEGYYGVVADDRILVVSTYGCEGEEPEILVYKKRG